MSDVVKNISSNALSLAGQPMFKLIDKARKLEAAGKSIIHLEIGDPDFDTPSNIVEAAQISLEKGDTHYCSSWGLPEFIDGIRDVTLKSRGFRPDTNQVLVTPGANVAIFYAIYCLVNAGEEVLVPDPGFPTYLSSIAMCGARAVPFPQLPQDGFRMRAENIEPLITSKTRLLILNSPNNPTGAITEAVELEKIFELARKHDIYIYSDEIYSRMVYEKSDFFSISSIDACKERVILSNGFSKAFAMTGWRLGTVVAPPEVAERMMMLLQTTASCVSPFIQKAGLEAILGEQSAVTEMMDAYRKRRNLLIQGLNSIPQIAADVPGGAFYAFADIRDTKMTSVEFANFALEEAGVALLPGTDFGEQGRGFVRLAYANSEENLAEAIRRLSFALETRGKND